MAYGIEKDHSRKDAKHVLSPSATLRINSVEGGAKTKLNSKLEIRNISKWSKIRKFQTGPFRIS